MRIISYLVSVGLSMVLSMFLPTHAIAQTWKPICVNGGNTAGAHNNTWQKVNAAAVGGGSWKKVGACVAPPPATCANGATNYPTCTLPQIDLSGIPDRIYSTLTCPNIMDSTQSCKEYVYINWNQDGSWQTNEAITDDGATFRTRSGWFLINGASPSDFQIYLHMSVDKRTGAACEVYQGIPDDPYRETWFNVAAGGYGTAVYQMLSDTYLYGGGGYTCPFGTTWTRYIDYTVTKISDSTVTATKRIILSIGPQAATY